MMHFAAKTHPGLHRSRNEDNYAAEPELGLWIVADGLGGHSNGEIASSIACEVIKNDIARGGSLLSAIEHAHREVLKEIQHREAQNNMGTTVVALRCVDHQYEIAWVGDSRAYLFDGGLRRLTTDHSAVNDLIKSGAIRPDQASKHPQRHALSRSLGVSPNNDSEAGHVTGTLKPGQQILLSTDGLTDELSDAAILRELRVNADAEEQVDALVQSALANGGRDNLTVVLVGEASREKKPAALKRRDLETTQNIGEPIREASSQRSRRKRNTALIVAVFLAVLILSFVSET